MSAPVADDESTATYLQLVRLIDVDGAFVAGDPIHAVRRFDRRTARCLRQFLPVDTRRS